MSTETVSNENDSTATSQKQETPLDEEGAFVNDTGRRALTLLSAYIFGYFMRYIKVSIKWLGLVVKHRAGLKVFEDQKTVALKELYYVSIKMINYSSFFNFISFINTICGIIFFFRE